MILRLAARGLRRGRWRSALAGAALSFAVAAIVVALALIEGLFVGMVRRATRALSGEAVVVAAARGAPLPGADALRGRLRALPGVAGAAPRLRVPALLAGPGGRRGAAELLGLDPAAEREVSDEVLLRAGEAGLGAAARGILLGEPLARQLGAEAGTAVTLSFLGADGLPAAAVLPVAGTLATGDPRRDARLAVLDLERLRAIAGAPGAAHEIGLALADPAAAAAQAARVGAALGPGARVAVIPWQRRLPALAAAVGFARSSSWWLSALVQGAAGLVVLAVLLVGFHERRREHALCLALGMPAPLLRAVILAEALLLGAGSALLGGAVGAGAALALSGRGIDLSGLVGPVGYAGGAIEPVLRASLRGWQAARAGAGAVAVAALAGWIAGRRLRDVAPSAVLADRELR